MNEKNKKELMILMPKLRRYCYALTNNKDLGDDLLHDAIVKILSKFHLLKIENFQAYIYRLISNTWKDNLRKKYTRNEISISTEGIEKDPALTIKENDNLDYISSFNDGVAAIKKDNQWAFINKDGDIVINFRNDLVSRKSHDGNYPIFQNERCLIAEERNGISYFI